MRRVVELGRGYPGLVQFAEELGVELRGRFRAAHPAEVEEIRRLAAAYNGAVLPEGYVEFLRFMGASQPFRYHASDEVFRAASVIRWYEALLSRPSALAGEARGCIFPGVPSLSLSGGEFVMPTAGPERGYVKLAGAERAPPEAQSMLALVYTQLLDEHIAAGGHGFAGRSARGERLELVCHVLHELACDLVMSTPRAWYWRSGEAWVVVKFLDLRGRVRVDVHARSDHRAEAFFERVSSLPAADTVGLARP